MAQFGEDQQDVGSLSISEIDTVGTVTFYFAPNFEKLSHYTNPANVPSKVKIAQVNPQEHYMRIYPINTLMHSPDFLKPKYAKIRRFILEEPCISFPDSDPYYHIDSRAPWSDPISFLLETLPVGFTRDYRYGLGLAKEGKFLIKEIENMTNVETITFIEGDEIKIEETTMHFGLNKYHDIINEINRIANRGQKATWRVKQNFALNTLAPFFNLEQTEYSLGHHPHSAQIALAAANESNNSNSEEEEKLFLSDNFASKLRKFNTHSPEKLPLLRRDIELISLEQLISNFETYLRASYSEKAWQDFFHKNLFALQQVFGMPTTFFSNEVAVGGRGLNGAGDKIVDFMFKNTLTNNIALVEIKRPGTRLLESRHYRNGIYGPHRELNNAITQALDQCYHLSLELPTLKNNSRRYDLESYNIRCIVIAGRTPPTDEPDKLKSLELFRNNLRAVTIITYDEILESLKTLCSFLSNVDEQEE